MGQKNQGMAKNTSKKTIKRQHRITSTLPLLDCDTIDITTRIINKQYFDIIVDDNGLLIDNYIFSYFENKEPQLAGNLLFTKSNEEGENIGLTNKQMTHIIDNLQIIGYTMGGNSFEGLHQFTD